MLTKLLHATTYENYLSIMKEGFKPKKERMVWTVSNPNHIYFFPYDVCENDLSNLQDTLFNGRGGLRLQVRILKVQKLLSFN